MLCISSFTEDVTFCHNGPDTKTWRLQLHEWRGDTGAESDVYECLFIQFLV